MVEGGSEACQAARDKFAIALNSVELPQIKLEDSLRVLELVARDPLPGPIQAGWKVGDVEVDAAIDALGAAVL